jgi:hypothetical protein
LNSSDLRPAGDFARHYFVKMLLFGGPGSGKTPLVTTAPAPVLFAAETGLATMRGSNVPTYPILNTATARAAIDWITSDAKDAAQFQTVFVDSGTQMAQNALDHWLPLRSDGRKAYGDMDKEMYPLFNRLYYQKNKHVVIVAKESIDGEENRIPIFPGKSMNSWVPHLFDLIAHLGIYSAGAWRGLALRCHPEFEKVKVRARYRTLDPLEPPDLSALFRKAML